jgi:hypothetical protein
MEAAMPEPGEDWKDYLRISDSGMTISVRNSKNTPWTEAQTWTLSEADQLSVVLRDTVTSARLSSPTVKKLAGLLRDLHGESSFEHMALTLVDQGWHDLATCPFRSSR